MKRITKKMEIFVITLYLALVIIAIVCVLGWMSQFTYDSMGEYAVNIAKMSSASLDITDEQLDELMNIEFDQLSDTQSNKELENLFKTADLSTNVEYSYVIRKLDESEIKYTINDEEQSQFFGESTGTDLNYIWLLDYIVCDDKRVSANETIGYFDDIYRYTTVSDEVDEIYNSKEAGYLLSSNQWGNQITGYAPIYTEEGTYIGLFGVDVFSTYYYEYRNKILFITGLLVAFLLSILLYVYMIYYVNIKKELNRDKLTGLYARKYYEKYGNKIIKSMKKELDTTTVIMVDIDNFKLYNDNYGHIKGDDVLANVARLVSEECEEYKCCVGRFGGEEFIIIAPNISEEFGDRLCEKIRQRIENEKIEHKFGAHNGIITISLGSVTIGSANNQLTLNEVIDRADTALYQAKKLGRNKYIRSVE